MLRQLPSTVHAAPPLLAQLSQSMTPLHFPLQEREGPALSTDTAELLAAVFSQQSLLDSYLAPHGQRSELQADRDRAVTELVQWVLDREAASEETEAGLEGSAWAAVVASVQPYIQR